MIFNLFFLFIAGIFSCYFLLIEKQSQKKGWIILAFSAFVGNLLFFIYAVYPKSSHAIDHNLWSQHSELFTFIIFEMIVLFAFGLILFALNRKKYPKLTHSNQSKKTSLKNISSAIFGGYLLFFCIFYIVPSVHLDKNPTIGMDSTLEQQKQVKWLLFTNQSQGFSIDYPDGAVIKDLDTHLEITCENGSKLNLEIGQFIDSPEDRKAMLKDDIISVSEVRLNDIPFSLIESEIPFFGHVYEYSTELDSNRRICFQLISPIDSEQNVRDMQLKMARSFKLLKNM